MNTAAKQPSKRALMLASFRIAGYHGDNAKFTRLLIENRINRTLASEQFVIGGKQRASGMSCGCYSCKTSAKA